MSTNHVLTTPRLVLPLVATVQLLIVLDTSVVNLALPSIQEALGFSSAGLSWVSTAYILAFGGLLLVGARLGDRLGRRGVFLAGVGLFTVSSLIGGLAVDPAMLVAARAVQGVGAALAASNGLALLIVAYPAGQARARAMGVFFATAAVGGAAGLLLGGLLTATLSWRWVLLINVPAGAAVVVLAIATLPSTQRIASPLDAPATTASTIAAAALVFGLVNAGEQGLTDSLALVALGVAVVAGTVFVRTLRRSEHPLVPLRLVTSRAPAAATAAMLLVPAVMMGAMFRLSQVMQAGLGISALTAGAAFLPAPVMVVAMSRVAPRVAARTSAGTVATVGALSLVTGSLLLTQVDVNTGYAPTIAIALGALGTGAGLLFGPLSTLMLSGLPASDAGPASAALQAAQQIGAAFGVAMLVAVFDAAGGTTATGVPLVGAGHVDAAATAFVATVGFAIAVLVLVRIAAQRAMATTG